MENQDILQVRHLTTVFRNEQSVTTAVNDVSFSLKGGETLAIVGESGSGKSVTALSVMRLIQAPEGEITKGTVLFSAGGQSPIDLMTLSEQEMRQYRGKNISMIFQEPMTSLNPVFTCGDQVAEVMRLHLSMSRKEAKQRSIELFREVRLPRPEVIFHSYPHEISGGQKQRVMIAMAMACNPDVLIADEPTTALDVTVQKTILELMKELQEKHNMGILFITHDLGLVSGFADRVLVMYRGKSVEEDQTERIFHHPQHPYTRGLLNCRPPMDVRLKRLPVVDDFMVQLGEEKPVFLVEAKEERKEKHQKIYSGEPILSVRALKTYFPYDYTFFGKAKNFVKAVDDVSFDVYSGETLGIVGESGCGKTTLGRTLLNLIKASSGRVTFRGKNLQDLSRREMRKIRKEIQIIFQDPYSSLNPRIMVGDAIMEPMIVHDLYEDNVARKKKAMELLKMVGIEKTSFHRYPHEFSGGQRQRICIARALSVNPSLIVCDESVSALDVSVQAQVLNLLNDLKNKFNFTCLFISHDLSVVKFMADRLIVMKDGKIEEIGEADEVYRHPVSSYTKQLLDAVPAITLNKIL